MALGMAVGHGVSGTVHGTVSAWILRLEEWLVRDG